MLFLFIFLISECFSVFSTSPSPMLSIDFNPVNTRHQSFKVFPPESTQFQTGSAIFQNGLMGPNWPSNNNYSVVVGAPFDGCAFTGPSQLYAGKVIMISMSSSCLVPVRAMYAAALGAKGLITVRCSPLPNTFCSDTLVYHTLSSSYLPYFSTINVTIPVANIRYKDGMSMINSISSGTNITVSFPGSGPLISINERNALLDLGRKVIWSGIIPGMYTMTQWSANPSLAEPCSGFIAGVHCIDGHIHELLFHTSIGSISGSIPNNNLQNYTELTQIVFSQLVSSTSFANLRKLQGFLIGAAARITFLDNNDWDGLESLASITIDATGISMIPSLSNLTKIQYIAIDRNKLSNFPDLSNCKNLVYLSAFSNQIKGSLPSFANFTKLYYFDVSINQINGSAEYSFNFNSNLVALDLSLNKFSGSLPNFIGTTRIIELNLQNNQFSGSVGCQWTSLRDLSILNMENNGLIAPMCLVSSTPNVQILKLSSNKISFTGTMNDFMRFNVPKRVVSLYISFNRLNIDFRTGANSNICSEVPSLLNIIMNGNQISELPTDLFSSPPCGGFPNYKWLDFSNCNISGNIPDWQLSPSIQKLFLNNNPRLIGNRLPSFVKQDTISPRTLQGVSNNPLENYLCLQFYAPNVEVELRIDASYVNFLYCNCQRGSFGKPKGSVLDPQNCKDVPFASNVTKFAGSFSDVVFDSEERFTPGIITNWMFTDFTRPRDVKVLYLNLNVFKNRFNQFSDVIELYEGSSSFQGKQISIIRGDSNEVNFNFEILNNMGTLRFVSIQKIPGPFFNATFFVSYACPEHFSFDEIQNKCFKLFEFSSGIQILVYVLSGATFATLTALLVLIYSKRFSLVVKSSSAPFCLTMIGFLQILSIASIFYAISPENSRWVCHIRPWLTCFSLVGVLSALVVKADRIRKIFTSTDLIVQAISNSQLAFTMCLLLLVQCALLIGFSSSSLGDASLIVGSGKSDQFLVPGCHKSVLSNSSYSSWFIVQVVFISLILIVGCYEAWSVRKVPTAFNEGPHIASCLMSMFVLLVIILPLNFMVDDNPDALILIRGVGQILVVLILTFFLFGPKVFYILEGRENDKTLSSIGSKSSSTNSTSSTSSSSVSK